jgi:hypothetical protein
MSLPLRLLPYTEAKKKVLFFSAKFVLRAYVDAYPRVRSCRLVASCAQEQKLLPCLPSIA